MAGAEQHSSQNQNPAATAKKRQKVATWVADREEEEYTYEELLARAMAYASERRHRSMSHEWGGGRCDVKPLLMRVGRRKTLWVNFTSMCQVINRIPHHVLRFYVRELGTDAWIDDEGRLLLRGRYVPKYVSQVWGKYVREYVACRSCGSKVSILSRDSIVRRNYIVNCQCCGASFSAGRSM